MQINKIRRGEFHLAEQDRPNPGPGQVLVKNLACGICGSDLHLFRMLAANSESGEMVLGHEFCSEIVAFGEATEKRLAIGQRVCSIPFLKQDGGDIGIGVTPEAPGAYSEYMLLTEQYLLAVPDKTSTEAAALAEPLAVAVHAVAKARLTGQDTALVMGCGPIGLAIIATLKLRGMKHIIASDYSPKRRALALDMGASLALDPGESNPFDALNSAVGQDKEVGQNSAASQNKADAVIFECIGAPGLLAQICAQAPDNARLIIAGLCTQEDSFNPFVAMKKELNIQFVFYYRPEEFAEALEILAQDEINWRPLITGKVGLGGIAGAFKTLSDPENHAKIIIDPWLSGDQIQPL